MKLWLIAGGTGETAMDYGIDNNLNNRVELNTSGVLK